MNINFVLQYNKIVFIKSNYKERFYKKDTRSLKR